MIASRKHRRNGIASNTPIATSSAQAGGEEQANGDGMECLSNAVDSQLRSRGTEIAEKLGEKAASGDLNSAKLMLSVAKEKSARGRKKTRSGASEALRLAAEPEWKEPAAPASYSTTASRS